MSGGRVRSDYRGIQAQRKAHRVKQEHAETAPGTVRIRPRRTRPLAALALAAALTVPFSLNPSTAATKAGVTPGALGVDESGQATYSIPIAVPPGIAGMEPSLSLNFNSGAGNGLLGVGWSIGGLSVVHRCPKTYAQDGVVGQVGYDTKDRFCLDGKRLILTSGVHGQHMAEYRTEIDSFAKIISHGAAATGPDYFTVRTKSGQYMEYGRTTDSRIEAVGSAAVRVWAVNKIRDSAGNYMNFGYTENTTNGGYRIAGIDYAVNDAAGVAHTNSVNFIYQSRPDVARGYLGGSLITTDKRLATIRTVTGGATVREYRLAYGTSPDTGRSRLTSVTECDGAGDCLKPTTFTWRVASPAYALKTFRRVPHPVHEFAQRHAWFEDVDGDGTKDFVRAFRSDGANNFQDVWLSTTSGWTHSPAHQPPFFVANHRIGFPSLGEFVDVNGDGLVDWVESYSRLAGLAVVKERNTWLNTGTGWSLNAGYQPPFKIFNYEYKPYEGSIVKEGQFLDVNGDGRVDWLRAVKISVVERLDGLVQSQTDHDLRTTWLNTGSGWATNTPRRPPFVIGEEIYSSECSTAINNHVTCFSNVKSKPRGEFVDANGDGLADFVQAYKDGSTTHQTTWMNVDGSFWSVSPGRQAPFIIYDGDFKRGEFVDVNGDGLADWVQSYRKAGVTNKTTWLSTGKGWTVSAAHQVPFIIHDDTTGSRGTFADVNDDGLPDWIEAYKYNGTEYRTTWINTGSGWQESAAHRFPFVMFDGGLPRGDLVEIDGQATPEPIKSYSTGGGSHFRDTWRSKAAQPDRIETVEDGLGRISTLSYTPLTNDDYYSKRSNAVFPMQDIQPLMYVVHRISQDDGVGGQADTIYTYDGAKVDVQGRGFLGFRYINAEDVQTGIITSTQYLQEFPFIGQIGFTQSRLANGTMLKKVTNTYDSLSLNSGKTVFPYVSRSIAHSYELNDGPNNSRVTEVKTDTVYDDFGNPTQIVVRTTANAGTFATTTNNTYTNNTTKWHLGRLTRAEVIKLLPDARTSTRVSSFAYHPDTGLLTQEVIEPDRPTLKLTTDYGHDALGNQTSVTVSGPDIETRSTTTTYTADGRFPSLTTNALGHSETTVYDARFGTVTSLTGPNSITTSWEYDGFGRKTREVRADGTETQWLYELCTGQCPAGAVYAVTRKNLITATGALYDAVEIEYHDKLNRIFRQETEGFDGTAIYVDTVYNARGQAIKASRPYFAGTSAGNIQWTHMAYDVTGREISMTAPDGGHETTAFDGLTATSTNALNQTETRTNNALGQLVQVTDNMGNVVTYTYDPHGNLETTNAGGVVTSMVYDIRGRKIQMTDPDMGVWDYDYNVLGELVSQTDAKTQTVTMVYDKLGRMTSRTEPEGTTSWAYDTATKGVGKLHTVTGPGGATGGGSGAPIAVNNVQSTKDTTTLANYTVAAGDDRILVVCGAVERNPADITGVSFAGQSLTQAVKHSTYDGGRNTAGIYYLLDAGIGAGAQTGDIVLSASGNDPDIQIIAFYLTNAAQTAPDATGTASNPGSNITSLSGSVTTTVADAVVTSCLSIGDEITWSPDAGQTLAAYEIIAPPNGTNAAGASYTIASAAGVQAMGWSGGTTKRPTLAMAAFAQAAASGGGGSGGGGSGSPLAVNNPQSVGGTDTLANYQIAAGDNRILVVCGAVKTFSPPSSIAGVSFAGQSLTQASQLSNDAQSASVAAGIYYLLDAGIGAGAQSGDIVVSFSGGTTNQNRQIVAFYLTDAAQTAPDATGTSPPTGSGDKTSVSGDVTTTVDGAVVTSCLGLNSQATWTPDTGQTQAGYGTGPSFAGGASYTIASAAGVQSMGWSGPGAKRPAMAMAAFAEAAGSGGGGGGGYSQTLTYDSLGRPSSTQTSIDGIAYTSSSAYDGAGRLDSLTYPSGFQVEYRYNAIGYLHEVAEVGGAGTVYWRSVAVNAEDQVTEIQHGNGLVTQRAYDPETALLETAKTWNNLTPVRDLAFEFGLLGNLMWRKDLLQDRMETFGYDGLNRLTGATLTDTATQTTLNSSTYTYDGLGNITFKSDVGSYLYGAGSAGPHAVTTVGTGASAKTYAYDANGAMISVTDAAASTLRTIAWSSFNKPTQITDNVAGTTSTLTYGPDRARYKQVTTGPSGARTFLYVHSSYEVHKKAGQADELVHYIRAGDTVAIYTEVDDANLATDRTRYLHRDHIGSIDLITGETGQFVERRSYDPHGKLRAHDWQPVAGTVVTVETRRGFTGHEHLDESGLIHMNGRVYDPVIGRFLSADPFVQDAANTQAYNRYSYVTNNPLSFTDPSGFFFKKLFKGIGKAFKSIAKFIKNEIIDLVGRALRLPAIRLVGSIGLSLIPGPQGILAAAAFSGLATAANGGDIMDIMSSAIITGVTAAAFHSIGDHFTGTLTAVQKVQKVVAHGVVGGVSTQLRGGKFTAGFLAGAATQAASFGIDRIMPGDFSAAARAARGSAAAAVGGTVAELGGGKFINGAITGAFSRLYNDEQLHQNSLRQKARGLTDPYVDHFDRTDPNFHDYEIGPTYACSIGESGCSLSSVSLTVANEALPLTIIPPGEGPYSILGFQPVFHYRPVDHIAINDTLLGHWFHPGTVVHASFEHKGSIWFYSRGVGVGNYPGLNNAVGQILFRGMHQDVLDHMRFQKYGNSLVGFP